MKLTYNRPPKVSVLRELDSLGFPLEDRTRPFTQDSFPHAVKPELVDLWDKFIETRVAQDLFNLGIDTLNGNLNAVLGFISYLHLHIAEPLESPYSLRKVSETNIRSALHELKRILPQWLRTRRIDKSFELKEIDVQMEDNYNDFIGAYVDVSAAIFLTFSPKKKTKLSRSEIGTKLVKNRLDPMLFERQRYMFKGKVPQQLLGKSRNLGDNGKKKVRYLDLQTVKKKKTTMWHLMDAVGNVKLFAHRSGEDTFTIKLTVDTPAIYYCGSENKFKIKTQIEQLISSILTLR